MGKIYDTEEIIKKYKDFANRLGRTPTQAEIINESKNNKNFPSYSAILRRFGSKISLDEICGFNINYKQYSSEELLDMIKDYNKNIGFPNLSELQKYYDIDRNIFYKRFGTYKNALIQSGIEIPKDKRTSYSNFKGISNEELLELYYKYYLQHGIPKNKDLKFNENMPSLALYRDRFGSIKNVLKLLNIEIPEQEKKNFSDFKKISDKDLLQILVDYNKNIGFPTQRKFKSKNNLPSSTLYFYRFGSFRNAILLAEIEIPEERKRWFDRESLSDEEMLKLLEYYTIKKLEYSKYLLTNDEIDNNNNMPHSSTYNTRFNGIIQAYNKIGIDYKDFNNIAIEEDMIKKYKELYLILGRTPHSRDIEYHSRNYDGFYAMSTYENHFGSVYQLQTYCEFIPTVIGKHKSNEELIEDLQELYERLGRIPTQKDVNMCEWMASSACYNREFGGFIEALKTAKITNDSQNKKCSITPQGNYCRSSYEFDFCIMLENKGLNFRQEESYSKYIKDFERKFRFDFIVNFNNIAYFIEIFGMMEHKWYRDKANYKIQLCKNNNLNIIDLYKEDFKKSDMETLYSLLINKILI